MNRKTLTGSRPPSRRRPRLFSRSPAPHAARAPRGAAAEAPHGPPSSGQFARRRRKHHSRPAPPAAGRAPSLLRSASSRGFSQAPRAHQVARRLAEERRLAPALSLSGGKRDTDARGHVAINRRRAHVRPEPAADSSILGIRVATLRAGPP